MRIVGYAVGLAAIGCGGATAEPADDSKRRDVPVEATPSEDVPSAEDALAPSDVLLDGTTTSTFAYLVDGGGLVDAAQQLIRGASGWASYELRGNGDVVCSKRGIARTLHLTRAEVEAFAERLQLAAFPSGHTELGSCVDGSVHHVRFGTRSISGGCGANDRYFELLTSHMASVVAECGAGEPFDGDVWVRAFPGELFADESLSYEGSPRWPASTPLSMALAAPADQGVRVTGEDARLLRALRDGRPPSDIAVNESPTPIREPDGALYFFLAVDGIDKPDVR